MIPGSPEAFRQYGRRTSPATGDSFRSGHGPTVRRALRPSGHSLGIPNHQGTRRRRGLLPGGGHPRAGSRPRSTNEFVDLVEDRGLHAAIRPGGAQDRPNVLAFEVTPAEGEDGLADHVVGVLHSMPGRTEGVGSTVTSALTPSRRIRTSVRRLDVDAPLGRLVAEPADPERLSAPVSPIHRLDPPVHVAARIVWQAPSEMPSLAFSTAPFADNQTYRSARR
jgi:hypothetical protein